MAWHCAGAAVEFESTERARGEFTVVVEGSDRPEPNIEYAVGAATTLIGEGTSTSDAVRSTADAFGVSRRELYDRVLRSREDGDLY